MPITPVDKIWMDGELLDWDQAQIHVLSHALQRRALGRRLVEAVPAATHSIFIGRVEEVALELDLQPLVYAGGDYGLIASLLNSAES